VANLVRLFLKLAPNHYEIACAALAAGDGASLARATQRLETQAAYFGARRLISVCRELARLGDHGELRRCAALLDDLEDELDRVTLALGSMDVPSLEGSATS
jgi:HPt (histidine-containing phosphotransfer) domain-containing protein